MPGFFQEILGFVETQVRLTQRDEETKEDRMSNPAPAPVSPPLPKPEDIKSLRDLSPVMVWEVLSQEKPQTIAFFLQNLSEDLRDPLLTVVPTEKASDLQQRPVFDHELSKQVFEQLSSYMIQFWKTKLSPEPSASAAFAS
mgnify:CR=1 FL=1